MMLEADVVKVLKNFAKINNSLFIKKDTNIISTISSAKNILARYEHQQTFPVDVCIYDLTKFINVINSYETFELDFTDQYVLVVAGNEKSKIYFADSEIICYPSKEIDMPKISVSFELKNDIIERIIKLAATLGVNDICFTLNDSNELIVQVLDSKNVSSNTHEIIVGKSPSNKTFEYYFSVDNLKIIPGDYTVNLTDQIISQFEHNSMAIKYWIAMNSQSRAIAAKSTPIKDVMNDEVDDEEDDQPF